MKAVRWEKYGPPDVLRLREVAKPVPEQNQVLVKVHASSVNAADYRLLGGSPLPLRFIAGLFKPKDTRIGLDLAGRVEAVGASVTRFKPGDEVFGCGNGAFAEYVAVREGLLVHKPTNVSFDEAAAVPVGGLTALQGLRDFARVGPGQKVLIQGASGAVGIFAIQLAKMLGAEVTAVVSPRNLEMARSLGADHVIDYTREDFTAAEQRYDRIFAINGYHPLAAYKRALAPQGLYICAGGSFRQIFESIILGGMRSEKGGRQLRNMGISDVTEPDLQELARLMEAGKIVSLIDRTYPLDEIVEAFRYVLETHPQGKVVIKIA
jgi:NADPH:quinone reductase-like Zn-dependent oxidoreductase